ncbi:MAG TPA: hypothetical protein ENN94_02740, partial [Geoalkalibacter subterraneus]|nr:hypothetical protein [Geoalkalibacter subterraneus]
MSFSSAAWDALSHRADAQQYFFRVQGVPDGTLAVKDFTGQDHGISQDYCFTINLLSESCLDVGLAVGRKARLEMAWEGRILPLHGVVSEISYGGEDVGGHGYVVLLNSVLHPLKLTRDNRVFLNTTAPQIIE